MSETKPCSSPARPRGWVGWLVFIVLLVITFALGMLGASIMERRQEARIQPPLRPIDPYEMNAAKWGENFPREYASYKKMAEADSKTKYAGSFQRDYLAETPANVVLFSGYSFAKDYKQARGHVYAVEDVTHTKRVNDTTVATCWTCKSPDVPRLMAKFGAEKLGPEKAATANLTELVSAGAGSFYARKFSDFKDEITHPIGCFDCHEPNTMKLRISRPALREAFAAQGKDIENVSHQEMRSLVCAQCHVTYYFKNEGNYLRFPWSKGTSLEDIEADYKETQFSDWTHAISKTPMIKTRHPDYELYSKGIHAYRNVACADCHMPYHTEGGAKFSDHHLQSPLLNVANSCAVCHRWSEAEIRSRVEGIQDKVKELKTRLERALTYAHFDVAACMQAGATDEELAKVRDLIRWSQLRWDFISSSNGMGFHAPQECMRILGNGLDLAQEARVGCARILARHGYTGEVQYPDFSTKEKAQTLNKLFLDGHPPDLLGRKTTTQSAAL